MTKPARILVRELVMDMNRVSLEGEKMLFKLLSNHSSDHYHCRHVGGWLDEDYGIFTSEHCCWRSCSWTWPGGSRNQSQWSWRSGLQRSPTPTQQDQSTLKHKQLHQLSWLLYLLFTRLTSTESSLSHSGTMKKDIPSNAPGSCTLLMSRAIRMTYGNRAVKYTTFIQTEDKLDVCSLVSACSFHSFHSPCLLISPP